MDISGLVHQARQRRSLLRESVICGLPLQHVFGQELGMRIGERIDRLLARLEWRWSLSNLIFATYLTSAAALPAWAVSAMDMFQQYAPLSWVLAGFGGLTVAVFAFAIFSLAYGSWVKSRYNRSLYEKSGFVDPMAKTFEDRRIFLSEFCLPSDQYIQGKTFINCEIIGPAILFFRNGNQAYEQRLPICDAIVIRGSHYHNAITLDNCTFRGCSFKRVTLAVTESQVPDVRSVDWLHWISEYPEQAEFPGLDGAPTTPLREEPLPPPPPDTGEKTTQ